MEKSQFETLKPSGTPFSFPPHRRSHLKSETFHTLVRILTHCYNDSQSSRATHIVPEKLTLDNGSNELGQGTGKEARDEIFGPDGSVPGNMSIRKDTVVDESPEVIGNQSRGSSQVQMVIDELEHIMSLEGYEEPVQDNSGNLLTSSAGRNQTGNGVFALVNNQEDYFDIQKFLMEESGNAEQVPIDIGHYSFEASKALESSLDIDILSEVSKPVENNEDKGASLKMNVFEEAEHEMQQKEIELVKSVCISSTMVSPPRMTADEEIEEGEISDDFGVYGQSMDLFLEDVVALEEKKVDEERISEDVINKKETTFKEQKGANEKDTESSSYNVDIVDNADNGIQINESNRNVMECKSKMAVCGKTMKDKKADGYNCMPEAGRKKNQDDGAKEGFNRLEACLDDLVLHGEISEEKATDNRGITSTEKDAGVRNKKKRGHLSKERKEKRKRMKRAEKNRQQGVKRLKLHPVLKPKTINYCYHYLKGRCLQGDKCSFSHDIVPLTKSTPCCHFARNSCMKGDDCPFDHQLAKYPCNNYVSKGSCSRGDNCMFSHKMPLKDSSPTASNVSKPELKSPSLPGIFPSKNTKQNISETVLKPPAQAPKGISFLSFGKSPLDDSGKLKQAGSSPKGDHVKIGNQMNQSASDIVQNLSEIAKRTPPALAPQGIDLHSFGKAPLDYCHSKKQATLPLNRKNSLVGDSSKLKQAGSYPKRDVGAKVGIQMEQSVSDTFHNMHEMPKRAPPAVAPPGIKSFSFGKAPSDDSSSKQQTSLPFSRDNSIKSSVQERQSASEKLQNSSAMPWTLPVSPLSACQSSGQLSDGCKNTPSSAQKALLSTLAFAAKYESGMKMDRSIPAPAVRAEFHKESTSSSISGSSQNDPMKAFDFIFGVGSKTKQ